MSYPIRLRNLNMNGQPDADGDVFMVAEIQGWASPDVETKLQQRHGHGALVIAARYMERPLVIRGHGFSIPNRTFDVLRIRRKIETAAELVTTPDWLYVDEPSPGTRQQALVQRSDALEMPAPNHNVQPFEIPVVAVDPRKYGQTLKTVTVNGGPVALVNSGNFETYATAILNTTATNPWIQSDAEGRLSLIGTNIPAGSYIDLQNRRTVHATLGIRDMASRPRVWWALRPGTNFIRSNASFSVTYRDAWI